MTHHRPTARQLIQLLPAVLGSLGCVVTSDCFGNETSNCPGAPLLFVENPGESDGCTHGEYGCTTFDFGLNPSEGILTTSFTLSNLGDGLRLHYNASLADTTDPRFSLPGELSGSIESGETGELALTVAAEQVGPIGAEILIESDALNPEVRITVSAAFSD
jgi:hypothetical protein